LRRKGSMSKATEKQVDGNHYSKLKIQPLQLAYSINASPCFTKLAKYITRDKDDKEIQLEKALHVIEIEEELGDRSTLYSWESTRGGLRRMDSELEILDFSIQFDNSKLIYDCLLFMYEGKYTAAILELMQLTEVVLRGSK
jgi:hypothetical protein